MLSALLLANVLILCLELASAKLDFTKAPTFLLTDLLEDTSVVDELSQDEAITCTIHTDELFIFACKSEPSDEDVPPTNSVDVQLLTIADIDSVINQKNCVANCKNGVEKVEIEQSVYSFLLKDESVDPNDVVKA